MKTRIIICVLAAGCSCHGVYGQEAPKRPATAAEKAATLYASAISQYRVRQWKQAAELLEKYVKTYATHEHVPTALLQLAYCRSQLKDFAGYNKALDQVIRKFPGSLAWFSAYGSKLLRAKALKDYDGYLVLAEAMLRRTREAPLNLHGGINRHYTGYHYYQYAKWLYDPVAARMGQVLGKPGWIMDVVEVADTPDRANRALRALTVTFRRRKKELPTDWQYAHTALLKKAGKTAEAEKAFGDYAESWSDDPRAIELWLLKARDAQAREDDKTVKAVCEHLIRTYAGAGSKNYCYSVRTEHTVWSHEGPLAAFLYRRLRFLHDRGRYEEFTELARHYLKTYTASGLKWERVIGLWVHMAQQKAEKGDASRIPSTLEMLEEFSTDKYPAWKRSALIRKIDMYILLKKFGRASELAAELISEKYWSADSFSRVSQYAETDKAFVKVAAAARTKWKIPPPNPAGKAFTMLNNLKVRLKDDQVRHAEEIGEEMFAKHRPDASTIEAVKLLADYYFKKVLPEPRDKWMDRMVDTYPHHPLTESVLRNRIVAEKAARRYERLASAFDTLRARFPGTRIDYWGMYQTRLACYDIAKDPAGKLAFVRQFFAARAAAGEILAIKEIAKYELAKYDYETDHKAIGDYWMAKAEKLAGKRARLYCLANAWSGYYGRQYYPRRRTQGIDSPEAKTVIEMLQSQKMDPELRWEMAFSDINLLAHCGDAAAALKTLNERLVKGRTYRDLCLRLDLAGLGTALGKEGLRKEGLALAAKLKKTCCTTRDAGAIELMLAAMYEAREDYLSAAEHYQKIVETSPQPARMYTYFIYGMQMLRRARSPRYAAEMKSYIQKINSVQELVPRLMCDVGEYYLATRNPAAMRVYKELVRRYPASAARDRLGREIEKRRR